MPAYTKTTWVNGGAPAINAANLQKIDDALESLGKQITLGNGLICAPKANLPEYHDGASDYFQDAFATADGWASMGADTVVSVASGELVFTAGASPTTFVRANKAQAASSRSVRIKWRCTQVDLTTLEYRTSGGGTTVSKSIAGQTSGIEDIMCGASFTDIEIRFNSTGNMSASTPVRIDFIQVYNPAIPYSSLALDASGNGNHGTVFGCTPVAGITGRALSFDKINDYFVTPVFTMPDIYTFKTTLINHLQDAANPQIIHGYGVAGAGRLNLFRANGTNTMVIVWWDGAAKTTNITDVFSNTANAVVDLAFSITWATGAYTVWKNGVSFATGTLTGIVKPAPFALYIGTQQGLLANAYFGGTIDDPRIYNRALTPEEIWELYQNPGGNELNCMTMAATAVPFAIPVRNSAGKIADAAPQPSATAGVIGIMTALDVASGGTLTMPAGSGTYQWVVLTYGATVNSVKTGQTAAAASPGGTASANCTVLVWRVV